MVTAEESEWVETVETPGSTTLVECQGLCGRKVPVEDTVDLVAGEIIGEYPEPEFHVGVTGSHARSPETGQVCMACAEELGLEIQKPAGERDISETNRYLTPSNIAAFLLGVSVMILVFVLV
jgi:hypothetical protein